MSSNLPCFRYRLLGSLLVVGFSLPSCVAKDAGVGDSLIESTWREAGPDSNNAEPDSGTTAEGPSETAEADEPVEVGEGPVAQDPGHPNSSTETDETDEDKAPIVDPRCGNGTLDADEECDEGPNNGVSGYACTERCIDNVCGDGHIGPDEACDDGNRFSGDSCDECQEPAVPCSCGDGVVDEGCEECDDGAENGIAGSNCTAECTLESSSSNPPSCGDNNVDPGEGCDNGNLNGVAGSVCTAECSYNSCGDGHLGPDEECDDGNAVDDDSCTIFCTLPTPPALCGDGVLDPGESCDFGAENGVSGSTCTAICQLDVCGDGHRGFEELCDDGNLIDDDNCPSSCGVEFPEPSFDAGAGDAGDGG